MLNQDFITVTRSCVVTAFKETYVYLQSKASQEPSLPDLFSAPQWKRLGSDLQLPKRQLEIARLICLGCTNLEIADRLSISLDTVRTHMRTMYDRLGIHCRVGVVVRLVLASRGI